MPMVDTSVAVATPSTTAVRISTGSSSAGSETSSVRPTTLIGARFRPYATSALR